MDLPRFCPVLAQQLHGHILCDGREYFNVVLQFHRAKAGSKLNKSERSNDL